MDTSNSALCIFDEQSVQTGITKSTIDDYFPITSIAGGGRIEFHVPGNSETYIDMNDMNIHIKFKITKKTGAAIDDDDEVGLNNLAIATLFKDAILTIGDTQVEGGQQIYPYLAYLHTVMQFQPQAQLSHMTLQGWVRDEATKFDVNLNDAFKDRQKWTEKGKVCELYGPLFFDLCQQSRPIISQTDLRIKLVPNKTDFSLNGFGGAGKTDFKIVFESVKLFVRRIHVNPSIINAHAEGLTKRNALYPINHTEVITFTIPAGQKSYVKDRLFPVQQPKMLMIAMVDNDAFNGLLTKNPFNFQHYKLNKIVLYRDGESVPGPALTPDYVNNHYSRTYANTMEVFKYFNMDDSNGLTYEEFSGGYAIYAFDLTATQDVAADYRDPNTSNNLRLELGFETDLVETINVIIYAVFDSQIEITQLRDVITHYNR